MRPAGYACSGTLESDVELPALFKTIASDLIAGFDNGNADFDHPFQPRSTARAHSSADLNLAEVKLSDMAVFTLILSAS
ncbi:hypothetical protein AMTR_s00075p00064730 [Amborella trichopoda]|uniref:Uncharacterized protein n=1 Tax=Amborella trichopoda TaxID=13333 RepID=W1P3W7_AMBTC|nr:hypothetical protein AMTR_s00075p00064730 [Amborella trichopoda]